MNGILAQAAALAAHARARALDPRLGGDDDYWASHSTFRYVKTLRFVATKRAFLRRTEADVATTPRGWMSTLPRAGVIKLLVLGSRVPLPPHLATALAGGTKEAIAVSTDSSSGLWVSTWEPSGERYPQQRIWQVTYSLVPATFDASDAPTLQHARARLEQALREIAGFAAADPNLAGWCETFQKAEGMLSARQPTAPYHPDILPAAGYTLAARQLLASAVAGFVFGGMGSWNDGGPASKAARPLYDRLTGELYAAVTSGLAAAINDRIA